MIRQGDNKAASNVKRGPVLVSPLSHSRRFSFPQAVTKQMVEHGNGGGWQQKEKENERCDEVAKVASNAERGPAVTSPSFDAGTPTSAMPS